MHWLVFPKDDTINTYLHNGSGFEKAGVYEKTGRIPVGILPGLELDAIFRE